MLRILMIHFCSVFCFSLFLLIQFPSCCSLPERRLRTYSTSIYSSVKYLFTLLLPSNPDPSPQRFLSFFLTCVHCYINAQKQITVNLQQFQFFFVWCRYLFAIKQMQMFQKSGKRSIKTQTTILLVDNVSGRQ